MALTGSDGKFEFEVWGKNLNDNIANTWVVANNGTQFTTIPYPRRYDVDFRWSSKPRGLCGPSDDINPQDKQ